MKMPNAPPSLRTRSDSSSSSVQRNSPVTRTGKAPVSPTRPLFSLASDNQVPPVLSPIPLSQTYHDRNSQTSTPDLIKRLLHRAESEVDRTRRDRQDRREPDHVVGVERPVDDHPARQRRRNKTMCKRRVAELDTYNHSEPAHRRDFRRANRKQPLYDFLAERCGALAQIVAHDHVQRGQSCRT